MNRYILFVLIAFSIAAGSCSGRKNKAEHRDIIPEQDLIKILTEVHLADGLLAIPEVRYKFFESDTLSSYIDVIENNGYTKPQMDRTMRYYFVRRPKKLIKIYDKVLGRLSEMESRVDKELPGFRSKAMNDWPGRSSYSFPDPTSEDTTWVDFAGNFYGTLYLKFVITIYPDDQSINPVMGLYFSNADTTGNEKRVCFPAVPFLKDGHPHSYNISINQDLRGLIRLKGWFINLESTSPFLEKHFRVDNIILTHNLIE